MKKKMSFFYFKPSVAQTWNTSRKKKSALVSASCPGCHFQTGQSSSSISSPPILLRMYVFLSASWGVVLPTSLMWRDNFVRRQTAVPSHAVVCAALRQYLPLRGWFPAAGLSACSGPWFQCSRSWWGLVRCISFLRWRSPKEVKTQKTFHIISN